MSKLASSAIVRHSAEVSTAMVKIFAEHCIPKLTPDKYKGQCGRIGILGGSETYAEFWATILNCIFTSYYSTDNYHLFYKTINFMLYFEILFSMFQMIKILDYMNIYDYNNLYENTSKAESFRKFYKEKSNVFSYYILKFILLYNIDDTFIWIYRNNNIIQFNKNQQNFNDLYELINILKSNPSIQRQVILNVLLRDINKNHINKMKTKYYDLKKKYRNDKFVLNTMRMSLFEL